MLRRHLGVLIGIFPGLIAAQARAEAPPASASIPRTVLAAYAKAGLDHGTVEGDPFGGLDFDPVGAASVQRLPGFRGATIPSPGKIALPAIEASFALDFSETAVTDADLKR